MDTSPTPASHLDQNVPSRVHDPHRHEELPSASVNTSRTHKPHHHHMSHRGPTRYKEKFQSMREKYDQVIAKREMFNRELELATAKEKQLQAENDLLLDTIAMSSPPQPSYRTPVIHHRHTHEPLDVPMPPYDASYDDSPPNHPLHDGGNRPGRRPSRPDSRDSIRASHSHSHSNSISHSNGVVNGSTPNGNATRLRGDAAPSDTLEDH